jgi:transcriptional regulator with PAS, ATPase and Fis domain
VRNITTETIQILLNYNWPGNIRELENTIEYMMTFCDGTNLTPDDLPERIKNPKTTNTIPSAGNIYRPLKQSVEEYERSIIRELSSAYGDSPSREDVQKICQILGISVASYYRKLNGKKTVSEDP